MSGFYPSNLPLPTPERSELGRLLPGKVYGFLKSFSPLIAIRMIGSGKVAIVFAAMAIAQQAQAQSADPLASLLVQDSRLASVAERLLGANAHLCRATMPLTGLVLHSRDQYRDGSAEPAFANGRIAISTVVAGSPSAVAGIVPGDGLVAIAGHSTDDLRREGEAPLRDSAFDLLADQQPGEPLSIVISRAGNRQTLSLQVRPGCRALVEIRAESAPRARSDGRVIQINYGLAAAASDEQLAVIFAHELGHVVLEHRRRLSTAGVEKGFFGEFGRNQQLNRQVEIEADLVSVHLLANAGYDPAIAPAFWRTSLGGEVSGGILHSRTYPSADARARLLEREIRDYLGGGIAPTYPGHLLARRDEPFG